MNEVIEITIEHVPFWGVWTTIWTAVGVAMFFIDGVLKKMFKSTDWTGLGIVLGVAVIGFAGISASGVGRALEVERRVEESLKEAGYTQVNLERDGFIAAGPDGGYVTAVLAKTGDNTWRVLELQ